MHISIAGQFPEWTTRYSDIIITIIIINCLPKRKELINWRLSEMCIFIMIPYISPQYLLSMYTYAPRQLG